MGQHGKTPEGHDTHERMGIVAPQGRQRIALFALNQNLLAVYAKK
jgi:hypothetical protein